MKSNNLIFPLIFLCSFFIISCAAKELPTIREISSERVLIKLSHQSTKSEMQGIQKELLEVADVQFNFGKSEFLEDGKLQYLRFSVLLPDGTRGAATADLIKLQYHYCGFLIDPNSQPSFKTGNF